MNTQSAKKEELRLNTPFRAEELEWRIQRSGMEKNNEPWAIIVPYVTARAIQERLDTVIGPANWMCSFDKVEGGFICTLSIKFANDWVMKQDGSDASDIEPFKGAISGSFKRAAVMWGMGRELYDTGTIFAEFVSKEDSDHSVKINDMKYYWRAPL